MNELKKQLNKKHLIEEIERVKHRIVGLHKLKKWGKGKYGKYFAPEMIDKDILKKRQLLVILNHRLNKQKHKPIEWNF